MRHVILCALPLLAGCNWYDILYEALRDPEPPEDPVLRGAGTWYWQDVGDPHGTDAVVGDPLAEGIQVARMLEWGVAHVYGSYGQRPVHEHDVIAAWNAFLHQESIGSQLLLGDPDDIFPTGLSGLLDRIDDRLVAFHVLHPTAAEQFDAVHLDIEPQAAADWSSLTPAQRYDRVLLLADAYETVRDHLDAAGETDVQVWVDLPVWFDNLPPGLGGTGSVGWPSVADRDAWYADLHLRGVDAISWMAYERPTASQVLSSIATEEPLTVPTDRSAIDRDPSVGLDTPAVFALAQDLEATGRVVDLHDFADLAANP